MYAISGLLVLVRIKGRGASEPPVDFENASKGSMLFEMIGPSRQPSGPHQSQLLLGAF